MNKCYRCGIEPSNPWGFIGTFDSGILCLHCYNSTTEIDDMKFSADGEIEPVASPRPGRSYTAADVRWFQQRDSGEIKAAVEYDVNEAILEKKFENHTILEARDFNGFISKIRQLMARVEFLEHEMKNKQDVRVYNARELTIGRKEKSVSPEPDGAMIALVNGKPTRMIITKTPVPELITLKTEVAEPVAMSDEQWEKYTGLSRKDRNEVG